ncbi:MAG: glycosyltransferase [Proteobacteria bacterium]|nr:glycosyltransferase [Pseudomonadota bacterium]
MHSVNVLVPSNSMIEELKKYKFKNLKLWNRGVDTNLFNPIKRNRSDKEIRLTYVGRVAIEKNVKAFLDIKGNYKKTVVGDGPELKKYMSKYPDIKFVGLKTGEELAKYYADADVFVFPSKTDTLGNVILESLASGTPIAAYPVTGPKDILANTKINSLDENLEVSVKKALKVKRDDCRNFALMLTWDECTDQYLSYMIDAKTGKSVI